MADKKNPLAGMVSAAAESLREATAPAVAQATKDLREQTAAQLAQATAPAAAAALGVQKAAARRLAGSVQQGSGTPTRTQRPTSIEDRQGRRRRVRYEDRYRRATFFFTPEQLASLDDLAYRADRSKSEIIRTALDEYLRANSKKVTP